MDLNGRSCEDHITKGAGRGRYSLLRTYLTALYCSPVLTNSDVCTGSEPPIMTHDLSRPMAQPHLSCVTRLMPLMPLIPAGRSQCLHREGAISSRASERRRLVRWAVVGPDMLDGGYGEPVYTF